MIIDLKTECKKGTVSRDDGKIVRQLIQSNWECTDRFEIDFNNLEVASVSFIDEAFGRLAFIYSKEELQKKLKFKNILDFDKSLLNDILISRYRQKSLGKNGASIDS